MLWRITKWSFRVVLFFFIFTILWVVVLKFAPIYFTPLMLIRKTEAYFDKKDTQIHYQWTSYDQISTHAFIAVVSSEDQRFPTHNGFDWEAIQIAMEENKIRAQQGLRPRGASTISQQVAKNVFLWNGGGYVRKAFEAYFTFLIELIWGKKRIIEVYLNIAEMGNMTFGVQAAAQQFWKKTASQLNAAEAATLAAVLPNPRIYSAKNPDWFVLTRRNQIMYQMQMLGGIQYLQGIF
ncbi:MAG: monofunctional biosynthetic peptidoglycan transglycosylase [Cytophagales bacterium]|nr:MAG: monofunctional biosynthetic peptidoglycan transglycosylase [Cytophagales bacterium]